MPTAEEDPAIQLGIMKPLFRAPRGIVYLTPEEQALVEDASGNRDVPSVVIGSGLNLPEADPALDFRRKHGLERPFVLYVGRIDRNKGALTLFAYFQKFLEETGQDVDLVLAGKSVVPIPDHPRIRHVGFISEEEKVAALRQCRLLVMPSPYESLSVITLEAWKLGVPVLANARCKVLMGQCLRSNGGLFYHGYAEFAEGLRLLLDEPGARRDARPAGPGLRRARVLLGDDRREDRRPLRADGWGTGPPPKLVPALQVQVEPQPQPLQVARLHERDPDRVAQDLLAAVAVEAEVDAQVGEALEQVLRDVERGLARRSPARAALAARAIRSLKSLSTSRSLTAVGAFILLSRGDGAQLLELLADVERAPRPDRAHPQLVGVLLGELDLPAAPSGPVGVGRRGGPRARAAARRGARGGGRLLNRRSTPGDARALLLGDLRPDRVEREARDLLERLEDARPRGRPPPRSAGAPPGLRACCSFSTGRMLRRSRLLYWKTSGTSRGSRPSSSRFCRRLESDSSFGSRGGHLAVGHEHDAVDALQHQPAGRVVEDLARAPCRAGAGPSCPPMMPTSSGSRSKKSVRSASVSRLTISPRDRGAVLPWIHWRFVVFPHRPGP